MHISIIMDISLIKKHYENNKNLIKKRINEFKQKRNDDELFEELCFCILTANTSARMGIKIIDNIKKVI